MLISFSVDNFRSIKDKLYLSLEATIGLKDNNSQGITLCRNNHLLNSIAFYGANSSGKTNILRAISHMRFLILHSVKLNDNDKLPFDPFLLSSQQNNSTTFEIVFLYNNSKYSYSFSYNSEQIINECLLMKRPGLSEKSLFTRSNEQLDIDEKYFAEGLPIINNTLSLNKNRLLISLSAQLGGSVSKQIIEWFRSHLSIISGINDEMLPEKTKIILHSQDNPLKDKVKSLLKGMNLGIGELSTRVQNFDEIKLPTGIPAEIIESLKNNPLINVYSHHDIYDQNGIATNKTEFDLEERESAGTNKLFNLAGYITEAFENGSTLFIDELDARMHPLISWKLVELFNSNTSNPNGAQLVFTTHDTNLLSSKLLRRDQIRFVEKTKIGSTALSSLSDIKLENGHKPRNDSNYQKNYLEGKYGAIPFINPDSFTQL